MKNKAQIFNKLLKLTLDYKFAMLTATLMAFLAVGSGIGLMMTSSFIIASAALQTPIFKLQVAIVGVRFFGIARGIFRYLERYFSHNITFKLLAKFRIWFFQSLEPLIPSKKFDLTSGDLLSRATEDVESLEHFYVRVISPPLVFLGISLLMFILLGIFDIRYSFIFSILFVGSGIGIPILTLILSRKIGIELVNLKAIIEETTVDYFQGIKELLVYDLYENWKKEILSLQNQILALESKMNKIQSLNEILAGLFMNLTVAVLLFVAIPDVNTGKLNGIYLSVITIGIMASFEIISQMPLAFQYLSKSFESAKRLYDILELPYAEPKKAVSPNIINNNFYNLKVHNLNFSYDGIRNTLSNINFELKEREKLAIVGTSGAGKSTLANILAGLLPPDSGEILIGNTSYYDLAPEQIRQIISLVPQKVHLFAGTIRENLLFAKPDATEGEILEALQMSQLQSFIERLPKKLDTYIAELGNNLSGGEIKRIGIARALLRNTPIIIFDEVTSHLDPFTESAILDSILKISKEKSIIYITHRLTRMDIFNHIIVIQNGQIVEQGKHSELIKHGFYYSKLFYSFAKRLE
ncbi:thiol reductant ABC exporter subunit CydC [Bacteroidetes/Chlorobi group bacterium MS-B_bin-24]|nr:MAG: thiol reductant ABC exporter subunit CydC [Bacteroidetes/Chlorobi group bacterium MS-B_bin-24]